MFIFFNQKIGLLLKDDKEQMNVHSLTHSSGILQQTVHPKPPLFASKPIWFAVSGVLSVVANAEEAHAGGRLLDCDSN